MASIRMLGVLVAMAVAPGWSAGQQPTPTLPDSFSEPMPLYERALGPFTRPISSRVPEVQAYFDQGMQMMYAFATRDATRSFRAAAGRDPACAICVWGKRGPGART